MTPGVSVSWDNANYQPLLRLMVADIYGNPMETTSSVDTSLFSIYITGDIFSEAKPLSFVKDQSSENNKVLFRIQEASLNKYINALMLESPYVLTLKYQD